MKTRNFITLTSGLIACWLGATFYLDVPVERYPQTSAAGRNVEALRVAVDPETPSKAIASLLR